MINLKEQYGKRYKVVFYETETGCYEIQGKYGYIRPMGDDLEMYLARPVIESRIEKHYPAVFKPRNHYDDATAFVFANTPELVSSAAKWVKARNRRQLTPEQRVALAARMRSLVKKPAQDSTLAG